MEITNTQKAYASDLAYIQQWANSTFGNFNLPMTEGAILLFITDHLQGMDATKEGQLMSPMFLNGYKAKRGVHSLATVRRRLFALTAHHKKLGYENPCASSAVRALLQSQGKKTIKQAITRDILEKLLTMCKKEVKGIRDKAILLLAWTTGGRRSELAAAHIEHLINIGDNLLLRIPVNANLHEINVNDRTAQALQDWITTAAIKQGAIFRSVNKQGKVSDNPLSPIDINRIVKSYCKAIGLNEKQFSAHSLRSGFMQEATNGTE